MSIRIQLKSGSSTAKKKPPNPRSTALAEYLTLAPAAMEPRCLDAGLRGSQIGSTSLFHWVS